MQLNELITEGFKTIIEGKERQQTSVHYGGSKNSSMSDVNVPSKAKSAIDGALKGDIAKENKNPQGEGGEDALTYVQKYPRLANAVLAGVGAKDGGIGAKITPNPHMKFTPPAPATD